MRHRMFPTIFGTKKNVLHERKSYDLLNIMDPFQKAELPGNYTLLTQLRQAFAVDVISTFFLSPIM